MCSGWLFLAWLWPENFLNLVTWVHCFSLPCIQWLEYCLLNVLCSVFSCFRQEDKAIPVTLSWLESEDLWLVILMSLFNKIKMYSWVSRIEKILLCPPVYSLIINILLNLLCVSLSQCNCVSVCVCMCINLSDLQVSWSIMLTPSLTSKHWVFLRQSASLL